MTPEEEKEVITAARIITGVAMGLLVLSILLGIARCAL
jgi:hypothetical protein